MSKTKDLFGGKPGAVVKADVKNYEGAPAFTRSRDEQLVNVLMTGTFEDTFYASAKELLPEALNIFKEYSSKDPEFLARAAIYARNEGLMRLSPITAVAVLSTSDNKKAFHEAFRKTILQPGDLQDFVQIMLSGKVREGMGRSVKKAVGDWLGGMTEYWAIKYSSEKQDLSIRDIYRLVRPKFEAGAANDLAKYIVHGEYVEGSFSQIEAYDLLKKISAMSDEEYEKWDSANVDVE
jgi:60 kDa SS-A/Ro ribonucleoprotein